jgi:2-oxoacid:acceptor oxidoreductase gamma subunit (pyruvate/2-ketoisovalerate family)
MVLDQGLMEHVDVTTGLQPKGWIVINSARPPQSFVLNENWNLATVDATKIAASNGIGTQTAPIVNTTMVGALVRVTGIVGLEDLEHALAETFPKRAEANQNATREAFEKVVMSAASGNRVPSVS